MMGFDDGAGMVARVLIFPHGSEKRAETDSLRDYFVTRDVFGGDVRVFTSSGDRRRSCLKVSNR